MTSSAFCPGAQETAPPDEIIALYRNHGTSEQFHSEVKTDLDLERLPSGKFAVNALVLTCGMAAYNLLRLIGQRSLAENRHLPPEDRMPIRKAVHRRRLRSVIQDLMYLAGRLVRHARRWGLALARMNPWGSAWQSRFGVPIHAPEDHDTDERSSYANKPHGFRESNRLPVAGSVLAGMATSPCWLDNPILRIKGPQNKLEAFVQQALFPIVNPPLLESIQSSTS
jgi:hypothetical protein